MGAATRWTISFAVAAFVAALAAVITVAPYLLLKVPRVGFILFSLAGGPLPPFFAFGVFEDSLTKRWMRPGDVFVASCGKCGSTWMMAIVHEIRSKGSPPPFRDIYLEVPFPELVYYPGQPLEERVEFLRNVSARHSFAAYKTHYHPPLLKLREDAKYLIGIRSFVDAVASLEPFVRSHGVEFAKMWGGFPPQAGQTVPLLKDKAYEKYVMDDMGGGKSELQVFLTEFLAAWWPYRNQENVLFVHYANLISNSYEELGKIADFLGVKLDNSALAKVVEHTSFQYMKSHSGKFSLRHVFDDFKARGKMPQEVFFMAGDLISTGPGRDGKNDLGEHLVQRIEREVERMFGPVIARWIEKGGPVPDIDLPAQVQ